MLQLRINLSKQSGTSIINDFIWTELKENFRDDPQAVLSVTGDYFITETNFTCHPA